MRSAAIAILGFALGAFLGLGATLTVIWLWFDVLQQGGDGPKPGLAWLFTLGPVLALGGGAAMAWWALRRDRRGQGTGLLGVLGAVGLGILLAYSVRLLGAG